VRNVAATANRLFHCDIPRSPVIFRLKQRFTRRNSVSTAVGENGWRSAAIHYLIARPGNGAQIDITVGLDHLVVAKLDHVVQQIACTYIVPVARLPDICRRRPRPRLQSYGQRVLIATIIIRFSRMRIMTWTPVGIGIGKFLAIGPDPFTFPKKITPTGPEVSGQTAIVGIGSIVSVRIFLEVGVDHVENSGCFSFGRQGRKVSTLRVSTLLCIGKCAECGDQLVSHTLVVDLGRRCVLFDVRYADCDGLRSGPAVSITDTNINVIVVVPVCGCL